jgi:hypothetical protein
MATTPTTAACAWHRWGYLKDTGYMFCCVKIVTYQEYVHIKACLAWCYIHRALGQGNMMLIPVPTWANYTKTKGHQHISIFQGEKDAKKSHVLSTIVQMLDVITSFNFNCYSPMMD